MFYSQWYHFHSYLTINNEEEKFFLFKDTFSSVSKKEDLSILSKKPVIFVQTKLLDTG